MSAAAHWFGPNTANSTGSGHPVMFGEPVIAQHFERMPDGGGYPKGFVEWALARMNLNHPRVTLDPANVLHLCSGSMRTGICVDIRPEMKPTHVVDCTATGLPSESFDFIMADPPYSVEYARNLYGTDANYPRPGAIVREACRLLRPGGLLGVLHFQVPMSRKPMQILGVYGVTTGAGYAIRAWTLLRKNTVDGPSLFGGVA